MANLQDVEAGLTALAAGQAELNGKVDLLIQKANPDTTNILAAIGGMATTNQSIIDKIIAALGQ